MFAQKFQGVSFSRIFVRGHFDSVTLPLRLVLLATNVVSLCTCRLPSFNAVLFFFFASDVLFGNVSNLVFRLFLRVRKGY